MRSTSIETSLDEFGEPRVDESIVVVITMF
jgi:hypothetical protein